jgi:hypothetical protein
MKRAYLFIVACISLVTACGARSAILPAEDGGPRSDKRIVRIDGPPRPDGFKKDGPKKDGPKKDGPKKDGPKKDGPKKDGPKKDGPMLDGPPDIPIPTDFGRCFSTIGSLCTHDFQCCGQLICAPIASDLSICSTRCTPDNPDTPLVNEDSCQRPHQCISAESAGSPNDFYCAMPCKPSLRANECEPGVACHPETVQQGPSYDVAYCARSACRSDQDCPVFIGAPCGGGQACPKGAFCVPPGPRSIGGCALPGNCDRRSGLCGPQLLGSPRARIGDPCTSDIDCGPSMKCELTLAPNGYCYSDGCQFSASLPHTRCPAGSSCNRIFAGGFCMRTCKVESPNDCRAHARDRYGDYECYDWSKLTFGNGRPIADAPTCDFLAFGCEIFPKGVGFGCEVLGLFPNNRTDMRCRDPRTRKVLPEGSPAGRCLDSCQAG